MCGDRHGAQKDRKPHPNKHGIRCPAPAGDAGEEIALQRTGADAGPAGGVERHPAGSPCLPRSAEPERGGPAAERLDFERHRVPTVDHQARRTDPERSDGGIPGAARMPESGRRTPNRPGRRERREPQRQYAGARQRNGPDRAGKRRHRREPPALEVGRLGAVGQLKQCLTGARGNRSQQGGQCPVAPGAQLLQLPRHPDRRQPRLCLPGEVRHDGERRERHTPRDQDPVGGIEPAQARRPRGQAQQQSAQTESQRSPPEPRPGSERSREARQGLPGRGCRHPPYPTA